MDKIITGIEENRDFTPITESEAKELADEIRKVVDNIETVIKGKREQVELAVITMLAEGHVLIEDVPGVGKTSLVSSLAKTVDCGFKRIQFTPDVMPSDVSGFSIYNQKTGEFEFRPGAAMSNIILADEINRASAKTQSAMLEIMEERQVTVDGNTMVMDRPFMVLATQNPIDSLGTYQLPEAQIDRFMIKLSLGYPDTNDEIEVITGGKKAKQEIGPVTDGAGVVAMTEKCARVTVSHQIASYIVHIVKATRTDPDIRLGSSPRGSISLYSLSRAYAAYQGRSYVVPDDIKYLAPYVLGHRVTLTHAARTEQKDPKDIINKIVSHIVVPVEDEK